MKDRSHARSENRCVHLRTHPKCKSENRVFHFRTNIQKVNIDFSIFEQISKMKHVQVKIYFVLSKKNISKLKQKYQK